MNVTFLGFGGSIMEYPCYEDNKGNLYFDLNDGKNGLRLYTGAYRSRDDDAIYGEPCFSVADKIECANPFIRHPRDYDYLFLSRLKMDCDYFLGLGNRSVDNLYYKNVQLQCDKMESLWKSFSEKDKPNWLTIEQIDTYRAQMISNQ